MRIKEQTFAVIVVVLFVLVSLPAIYMNVEEITNPKEIKLITVKYQNIEGDEVVLDDITSINDGSWLFKRAGSINLKRTDGTVVNIGEGTAYTYTSRMVPNPNLINK